MLSYSRHLLQRYGIKSHARSVHVSSKSGLFGIPGLIEPGDFRHLTQRAIERCDDLRYQIRGSEIRSKNDASACLKALDGVSNEVCSVIDVAELCRNVHADPRFREVAEESFAQLSGYIHTLNADVSLYDRLCEVVKGGTRRNGSDGDDIFSLLSEEEQLLAQDLKAEFESDGIHLRGQDAQRAQALQQAAVESETAFSQHLHTCDPRHGLIVGPVPPAQYSAFKRMLSPYQEDRAAAALDLPLPDLCLWAPPNPTLLSSLCRMCSDPHVRRQLWTHAATLPHANQAGLGELVRVRHDLAQALGHESYVHKQAARKRAIGSTPEDVWRFLLDTADALREPAEADFSLLRQFNRSRGGDDDGAFGPADLQYLMMCHQSSQSADQIPASVRLSSMLRLDHCLAGLNSLVGSLFGISLQQAPIDPTEAWADVQAAGLTKLQCTRAEDGEALGTVFLDLYRRPYKFQSSAHFTVRCGMQSGPPSVSASGAAPQLPIVMLVFGFPATAGSSSGGGGSGQQCLSLGQLEALVHEFGHALHSLLSRTTFQHLSGTRGALDLVEVPSHLMEELTVRNARVLTDWVAADTSHTPDGVGIGAGSAASLRCGLVEEALEERSRFAALDAQTQLLYAAADQLTFGPLQPDAQHAFYSALDGDLAHALLDGSTGPMTQRGQPAGTQGPGSGSGFGSGAGHREDGEIYQRLQRQIAAVQRHLTGLPLCTVGPEPPTSSHAHAHAHAPLRLSQPCIFLPSHSHFTHYGGGYYAYLFSRMYATQIARHLSLDADPYSRRSGQVLWNELLRYGSSRPPAQSLAAVGGGQLSSKLFLERLLSAR